MATAIRDMVNKGGDDPELKILDSLSCACRAVGHLAKEPACALALENNKFIPLLEQLQV